MSNDLDLAAQQLALLQRADLIECAADPLVFMRRHCTIELPTGEAIPFDPWPMQAKTVETIHQNTATIVLKARRLGLSWIALYYALWMAIFQQGARILILCKTGPDASELLDRVRRTRDRILQDPASSHILAGLPKAAKTRDARTTLDVGESTIKAIMGTPAAARSETAALWIADEFAFQRAAGEIWQSATPTIEGGGKVLINSTGNGTIGIGKEYASQWSRAVSGESGFTHLFWPWDARPDRDSEWKERTLARLGDPERFKVEYPETPDDAFISPHSDYVYPAAGIDAAEKLGREIAELIEQGELEPVGGVIHVGTDWGEHTHALPIWELEGGGLYIPPKEVVALGKEPGDVSMEIVEMLTMLGYPLGDARYDAAGVQSQHTFMKHAPAGTKRVKVPFSKMKVITIQYLRRLFACADAGHKTGVIGIHPANTELLRQLRGLEYADRDVEKIDKHDDHGPDALVAGAAKIAHRHRKREDNITD